MIEATCAACGTEARIAESDVPPGAKFVTCASCKSRVPLPAKPGAATIPAGAGALRPPAIPPPKVPAVIPPIPRAKSDAGAADLPAPKTKSPPAIPARPGTDGDLPAPKTARPPAPPVGLDLDDPRGDELQLAGVDLPAPKAVKADAIADLPAPRPRTPVLGDLPASKPKPASALGDLPPSGPKGLSPFADLPAPKAPALADLPAPKAPALADLPPPKASALADLPAPKNMPERAATLAGGPGAPRAPAAPIADLPAPKRGGSAGALDLDGGLDLPTPKTGGAKPDLPAPKGFFDDLPQPASSAAKADLPAPKGFFDDLPAPARGGAARADLPAPKGFFDDLPQPASSAAKADLPAPKGFFDDLPAPKAGGSAGLFDDLPDAGKAPGGPRGKAPASGHAPAPSKGPATAPTPGLFDDLPKPSSELSLGDIDLSPGGAKPLELDGGPELDLGLPRGQDQQFTDLDLGEPSRPAGKSSAEDAGPIKIKTPKGGAPATPIPITVPASKKGGGPAGEIKLDLADDPRAAAGAPAAVAKQPVAKKRAVAEVEESPEERAAKRRRTRIVLASVLGVALLGAGGFFYYQRHQAAQARADEISRQIAKARRALTSDDPSHWATAASAARRALEVAPDHPQALGLAAEAAIGGALDDGINGKARIEQGRKLIQDGLGAGKTSPELDRAQAIAAIAANQPDRALRLLEQLLAKSPKDGWLHLYMGWALLAKGDPMRALAAFDQAVANAKETKLPALYGHGRAKLQLADMDGARTFFSKVLETSKDHIGAQVGLAATLPPSQARQREAELLAILERSDVKRGAADPRAVVLALALVGDVARDVGRLDIARERYGKALALAPLDLPALTGLAQVELRDGKVQVAADLVQKALAASAEDVAAQLLSTEIMIVQGKLPEAQGLIEKLGARKPPLAPLQHARLHVLRGKLFEARGEHDQAADAYTEGAKRAGELDLAPTMAAVAKLSQLAKAADSEAKAAIYRDRADQLLSALAERAQEDPELSATLGVAYLQSGDAAKAEVFLRRSVTMRGDDPESKLQLARAVSALGRTDEAIAQLQEALVLDDKRIDIALELARTYQNASRHPEAVAAYEKLLAMPNVPLVVRANAGRYFARRGLIDQAAAQADPILETTPDHPAGLFLRAEGQMKAGSWQDARLALTKASDADEDAQYLDALGRAYEGSYLANNDTKFIEGARHAYERAARADPTMLNPQVGQGRMLIARKDWEPALKPLIAAAKLAPTNSEVMYFTGLAYFGLRNQSTAHKKTAAQWLEQAFKAAPELALDRRAEGAWRLAQLYHDLNKPADAIRAYERATQLGEQAEKELANKRIPWLNEAWYQLGDMHKLQHNKPAWARAWRNYRDREAANPTPNNNNRLKDVNHYLNTELQRY